jgi:hypothetical protein
MTIGLSGQIEATYVSSGHELPVMIEELVQR